MDYRKEYTDLELNKIVAYLRLSIDVHKNALKLAETSLERILYLLDKRSKNDD